jgi:ADP-L-glycero-D-manno-heptose 6-epimerase
MLLFRSHHPDFEDGMQARDFIYVKDVVAVILFMMEKRPDSGLFNLGTGKARSFQDLAQATFLAMEKKPSISYIDTPEDIRDKYQYFTQADIAKLRKAGYRKSFTLMEEGIDEYIRAYLNNGCNN